MESIPSLQQGWRREAPIDNGNGNKLLGDVKGNDNEVLRRMDGR